MTTTADEFGDVKIKLSDRDWTGGENEIQLQIDGDSRPSPHWHVILYAIVRHEPADEFETELMLGGIGDLTLKGVMVENKTSLRLMPFEIRELRDALTKILKDEGFED